jgi:hypothetical protein
MKTSHDYEKCVCPSEFQVTCTRYSSEIYRDKNQSYVPLSFTILLAIKRCRIAQPRIHSGTTSVNMNSTTLFLNKRHILSAYLGNNFMSCVSTGSGILGCIATHVHKNIVIMQLHIIPESVLQLSISLHEGDVSDTSRAGARRARAESEWMKNRKNIMHGRVAYLPCLDDYI